MKNSLKNLPPYEGEAPYLYLAFSEEDAAKVKKILRLLMERGCRVWYCFGTSGSAEELRHRQARSEGASLTAVFLSEAACRDQDTKSRILVNQKYHHPILILDPDGAGRRFTMGLQENIPALSLFSFSDPEETLQAILHADGFSQDLLGEPVNIKGGISFGKLAAFFCLLGVLLAAGSFFWSAFRERPETVIADEVIFSDPVIESAVRNLCGGGSITRAFAEEIRFLPLSAFPENWEDLSLLPALSRIELPQEAVMKGNPLPDGNFAITLTGGDGP